jgi:hypothetical protein
LRESSSTLLSFPCHQSIATLYACIAADNPRAYAVYVDYQVRSGDG